MQEQVANMKIIEHHSGAQEVNQHIERQKSSV